MNLAWTYTLRELAGSAWGTVVFACAAVAPGFCMGHLVAPAWFRSRALCEQLAWSVGLSFGPGVLLVVASVALGGATAGAGLLLVCAVVALAFFRKHPPARDVSRRHLLFACALFMGFSAVVLGSLVDLGTQGRLWMSVTAYDHSLRTAFVDAVLRSGAAPIDPVYWPGHPVATRYYYFWYVECAAVARLAHISGRDALIASCLWPLVGVVAMLALFTRYALHKRGPELRRFVLLASALLGVTGLDLLVTIALHLLGAPALADMEWWSIDQVASWPDTFLWVPHHAAALVAALLGLLLLLRLPTLDRVSQRVTLAAVAGLSFASAFGMSAYIAVGAAIVAIGLLLTALRDLRAAGRTLQGLLVAAATAAVADSRFLYQLTRHEGASAPTAAPLYLGLREILSPVMLAGSHMLHGVAAQHPWRARELAAAILLLPGWGVELGFYGVVLLAALWRWRRLSEGERTLVWLTLAGLLGASVLRSGVIATNDYGIRAALLPQFFLLLLGAAVFSTSTRGLRRFLQLLLIIGASGCLYQLVLLRTYLPWQQAHGNPEFRDVGEHAYVLQNAYAALQTAVPVDARLQFDPASTSFFLYPHLLFGNRQLITAEITCSTSFGGDPAACPGIQSGLHQLFPAASGMTPNAPAARSVCGHLGMQFLLVTSWDSAWRAPSGWVWTLPAVVSQPQARVLACAPSSRASHAPVTGGWER